MSLPSNLQAEITAIGKLKVVPELLNVVCKVTGMGFAAVARVTDTHWIACEVQDEIGFGLKPGGELPLASTICNEIRASHTAVVIDSVKDDPNFFNHHTPATYGFQSYISFPIFLKDGTFFGTLCAIDPRPNILSKPEITTMFRLFAELISAQLASIDELSSANREIAKGKEDAQLREEFIAVVGHDLRNPISAIYASSQVLMGMNLPPDAHRLLQIIKDGSFRMKALTDNLMDFARGRLGGGIHVDKQLDRDLDTTLRQIVNELSMVRADKIIDVELNLNTPVYCEGRRVAQVLSNLLGNALSYGKGDHPIKVNIHSNEKEFSMSVSNVSDQMPADIVANLFKPFSRSKNDARQDGLGLGLYISSEIAAAHAGKLICKTTADSTTFIFSIPVSQIAHADSSSQN